MKHRHIFYCGRFFNRICGLAVFTTRPFFNKYYRPTLSCYLEKYNTMTSKSLLFSRHTFCIGRLLWNLLVPRPTKLYSRPKPTLTCQILNRDHQLKLLKMECTIYTNSVNNHINCLGSSSAEWCTTFVIGYVNSWEFDLE